MLWSVLYTPTYAIMLKHISCSTSWTTCRAYGVARLAMKVQQQRVRRCAAQHSKDEASQQQRLSFCPVSEDTSMPYFRHDNTKHDPMPANIGPAPKWSSHAPITVVRLASTVAACSCQQQGTTLLMHGKNMHHRMHQTKWGTCPQVNLPVISRREVPRMPRVTM